MPCRSWPATFAVMLAVPMLLRAGELPVRADVERLIADSGADVAVAFRTLDGRDKLLIQPDVVFHAASTMKVPVMIELYRQARAGVFKFNDRIPAGLPSGVAVAHKTGEITKIQHDAAIVFAPRPFALVVLVRGLDDVKKGSALAADIARVVYAASQAAPTAGGF